MKVVIFILFFSITLFASPLDLNKEEKDWIKNNEIIIGSSELYPLMYTNKEKKIKGFSIDILEIIIKKFNLKTRIINVKQSSVPLAIKENEIDLAPIISNERVENTLGLYSSEVLQIKSILFVKKENKTINSLKDLKGKKVAIVDQIGMIPHLEKRNSNIKIERTITIEESVQKLLEGKVDALISSPLIIQNFLDKNINNHIKAMPFIRFNPVKLYFFINKKKILLHSIIEKGLNTISIKEKQEIFNKWFLKDLYDLSVTLSEEEKKYLKNKNKINLCVDPDWMPYEKIKDGKHIGIVADYMKSFEKKIGIPFNLIETYDWTESLSYIKNRNCDVLSLVIDTKKRRDYMSFTKPYVIFSLVLVTKRNVSFVSDLKSLDNKKIGIQKDFAYKEVIKKNYPNLEIIEVDHLLSGLTKVERGELFGQVSTDLSTAYAFQKEFYGSLEISGKFDEKFELSVGVRNDEPKLLSIFEKVVSSINEETRRTIISRWVTLKSEKSIDYKLF